MNILAQGGGEAGQVLTSHAHSRAREEKKKKAKKQKDDNGIDWIAKKCSEFSKTMTYRSNKLADEFVRGNGDLRFAFGHDVNGTDEIGADNTIQSHRHHGTQSLACTHAHTERR